MKYKWFFDESGVLTECEPKLDNDTKLEFAPETDEMFYRAKLSGALTFQNEFDAILAKDLGYTHIVVLKRYSDTDNDYVEVWRGKFTLTDCTINYDRKTIEVTPKTIDRYTDILAALETDYNIVKLAPQMHPVNINIRPCLQIYCGGDTKLTNYTGGSVWEASCESNLIDSELQNTYHFAKIGEVFAVYFERYDPVWNVVKVVASTNNTEEDAQGYIYLTGSDGNTYKCFVWQNGNERRFTVRSADDQTWLFSAYYFDYQFDHIEENQLLSVEPKALSQWSAIYSRALLQTDLPQISLLDTICQTYDVPTNDIAGAINMNFNKVAPIPTACVQFISSTTVSDTATEWGQSYTDQYFVRPTIQNYQLYPVAQSLWKYASLWIHTWYRYSNYIDNYKTARVIKDSYDLRNTISKLLRKAGWTGQYVISGVFGTRDYVGANLLPIITPKSNVISSYYDTPAQNAPISLAKIFRMLKQAYKVYWYIDENNNLHLEHISYFQNGYSYTELPQTLVDLESDLHTRTKHSKAYGQNIVKFDKSGMAAVIAFGWMDKQTVPFDGYDIKALDSYVEQGAKEENTIADFSTDVDFVLSSPNDVSKDGFFLFALPNVAPGVYSNTLKIEKINITDENGDNYDVTIQNGDAAFCKIHKTFWRYDMPCENLQINNVPDTALTTGRFKTQSLEFSDLAMADVIQDVDNCIKLIKTQQGFGAIAKLSINLNSLATTADLVFTLVGRKYYLKGAALNGPMTITLNGEQITITVSNNRFVYGYTEPINELKFAGTDVVSVDFADTDTLAELTSADDMFKNCAELIAVNFANKAFGAVTTANDMFKGCSNLVDLICPATESWKPDIDFSDCPNLTLQSLNDLIVDFLYQYDSGVHTITPNGTMWNALTAEQQTDIMAKATAKGWQIGVPAQYALKGTSTASAVYATINGAPVEIEVVAGAFRYEYNLPITSISFENDGNVTAIDFTESDLLAGITSLNDAFKGCAGLVSVDFTGCDLSNVATATDCFSGCVALTSIVADSGVWQPDLNLSDSAMAYADMLSTIGILYTYVSGVHTITFNQTIWDSFTQAQQQTISDAASAKGWTTNAVMVVYVIRGTSTNVNGTETFNIQFINDGALSPSAAETITCAVDGNGDWEYQYQNKKIYSLSGFSTSNTLTALSFVNADDFGECVYMGRWTIGETWQGNPMLQCQNLATLDLSGKTLNSVISISNMFADSSTLPSINMSDAELNNAINAIIMFGYQSQYNGTLSLPNATFASVEYGEIFAGIHATAISVPSATFDNMLTNGGIGGGIAYGIFYNCTSLASVDLSSATFNNLTDARNMFRNCQSLSRIDLPSATFKELVDAKGMFQGCSNLEDITWSNSLNFSKVQEVGAIGSAAASGMFMNCTKLKDSSIAALATQTFNSLKVSINVFGGCNALTKIDLHSAIFGELIDCWAMFADCTNITEIDLSAATFAKVTVTQYIGYHAFMNCNALITLKVPENSTAILPTSTPSNAPMYLGNSPLTYQSMLKVANWLSDLTGYTAHTCTFKTSAWNALSNAEQTTIDSILSGKNWNRAIA